MPAARIIIDPDPRPGPINMAIDEVLLESALDSGISSLRFYQWSQPTLSLGYFQKPDDPDIPASLRKLPIVRRLSGGGAIVHHYEWTYSCAVPAASPLTRVPAELYTRMHKAIVKVLRRHGIDAKLRRDSFQTPLPGGGAGQLQSRRRLKQGEGGQCAEKQPSPQSSSRGRGSFETSSSHTKLSADAKQPSDDAFLCFTRGDPNDVMLAGHKILGSAQRRRRGAILQHGSLLWRASEYAPDLPGICELATAPTDLSQFHFDLAEGMGSPLGDDLYDVALTDEEMDRALELEMQRYRHASGPAK